MVTYDEKMMLINEIKLTPIQNKIVYGLITKRIVSRDEIDKMAFTTSATSVAAVHISRLRIKIGHLIKIETQRGAGYYIKDKSNIKIKQGGALTTVRYADYRLELKEYIDQVLNNYKKDLEYAEKRLKESLEEVL